ncbi:MAG: hypothetical protein Q9222_007013 [Ikaeria aurantiellina]
MPPAKKRKLASATKTEPEAEMDKPQSETATSPHETDGQAATEEPPTATTDSPDTVVADKTTERQERFKALQARAKHSAQRNLKEAAAEAQRQSIDPNLLASLGRKQAIASHKLLKADTAADGEDFERKRAWDWTVDEAEKWDKRMAKKEKHREDVAFQDYRQDARKIYKRQLRELQPDMEGYEREKAAAVQKAAMNGGLEIVETEDGELAAVDKNGAFYSTADSTDFIENKPQKAAVDRLVGDIKKAEEVRLRKRRERGKDDEQGDITYINDKNKQFNQKLARFYNKKDSTSSRETARSISIRSGVYRIQAIYSIPLLQATLAKSSILCVPTTPFTPSSSIASTTASATKSAFNGFSTAAPASGVNRPPTSEFTIFPALPAKAIGMVKALDESYRNPGRMNILLSFGNDDAMVDSASRFVVMYRFGSIGAPAAAEM